MTRTQLLKDPNYYIDKLEISHEEAVELIKFDKEKISTKKYLNEEETKKAKTKKKKKVFVDDVKLKARKLARKIILEHDDKTEFDNGSIRMSVEKELGYKIPHQTITAEITQMVKDELLTKEKAGNKMMYKKTKGD